ncbi:MAG: pctB [Sedimentibacter sp.]|nr:pctB [Sedimentibacter sp.]
MIGKLNKKTKEINEKKRIVTIRTKLLSAIATTCIILLSINSGIIIGNVRKDSNKVMNDLISAEAGKVSEEASAYFEKYITIAEVVATNPTIHDYLKSTQTGVSVTTNPDYNNVLNILRKTQQAYSNVVSSVYVAEESPSSYITSSKTVVKEDVDLTAKAYYLTLKDGQTHISEPYVDANTGALCVTISVPIKIDNQTVGEVCVDILITTLSQITADSTLGETGSFMLLSKDNKIVYHKDSTFVNKNIKELEFDSKVVTAVEGLNTEELISFNEVEIPHVGYLDLIGESEWKLVSYMTEDEFSSTTDNLTAMTVRNSIIIGLILIALVYVVITKSTKPLKEIQDVADKLAQGNLDVAINVNTNDEIGLLGISISHLIERLKKYIDYIDESSSVLNSFAANDFRLKLKNDYSGEFEKLKTAMVNISNMQRHIIGEIKDASAIIDSSSEQIAYGATATSQGATEQASGIEELSAEISQMADAIATTANSAKEAGKKSLKSSEAVSNGNKQMEELLNAIDEISNSSSEIGKIIKVIDDIAFQTNILALNAAVEAARAGAAGKGFAVVADEVRNLAGKSAEAAKTTTSLIENSVSSIIKGSELAGKTGEALAIVVETTEETSALINNIVEMSEEQAIAIEQIKTGIEQISEVVQENAATAENSAANSEELAAQVANLNELMNKFILD